MTGLLHDLDYERHPTAEEHPYVGANLLKELGYPEVMIEAILGHAPYTGVPRTTLLAVYYGSGVCAPDRTYGYETQVGKEKA